MENRTHHFRDGNVVLYERERGQRWQARMKLPNDKGKRISTKKRDAASASRLPLFKKTKYLIMTEGEKCLT